MSKLSKHSLPLLFLSLDIWICQLKDMLPFTQFDKPHAQDNGFQGDALSL